MSSIKDIAVEFYKYVTHNPNQRSSPYKNVPPILNRIPVVKDALCPVSKLGASVGNNAVEIFCDFDTYKSDLSKRSKYAPKLKYLPPNIIYEKLSSDRYR